MPASGKTYAFLGRVVRLTDDDFLRWQRAFRHLDIMGHLQSRDDWLSSLSPDDSRRKNWFMGTSGWLARENQKYAPPPVQRDLWQPDAIF